MFLWLCQATVGPDNLPGYDKVEMLARYLFSLRSQEAPLSNAQAERIAGLWHALADFDKKPAKLSARAKTRLTQGRFKATKKTTVTPGLDSTKRLLYLP